MHRGRSTAAATKTNILEQQSNVIVFESFLQVRLVMMHICSVIIFFHLTVFWTIQVCPETILGFIGGSIVIPCSSEEKQASIQDITVRWRQNSLNVYDIIKGTGSVERQDPAFKNRAETFPKKYLNGNFSLKLNSLRNTDEGQYTCYIIEDSIMRNVNLIIEEKPTRGSFNQGTKLQPDMTAMIISILCIGFSFSLANFATGRSVGLLVPVPSPDRRRRGGRRMPVH